MCVIVQPIFVHSWCRVRKWICMGKSSYVFRINPSSGLVVWCTFVRTSNRPKLYSISNERKTVTEENPSDCNRIQRNLWCRVLCWCFLVITFFIQLLIIQSFFHYKAFFNFIRIHFCCLSNVYRLSPFMTLALSTLNMGIT